MAKLVIYCNNSLTFESVCLQLLIVDEVLYDVLVPDRRRLRHECMHHGIRLELEILGLNLYRRSTKGRIVCIAAKITCAGTPAIHQFTLALWLRS